MWTYRAQVVRVVDGDSAILLIDQGFGGRQQEEIRLVGVSAPELRQPGGREAYVFTVEWMARTLTMATWPLRVTTVPTTNTEPTERRSFVRYVATVADTTGRVLNVQLADYLAEHPEWGSGI